MAKRFASATAFKSSFEERLRQRATAQALPLSTLQLKFVMERLLARLFRLPDPPWLLKGGFAMDLRFRPNARSTKDLDLSAPLVAKTPDANWSADLRDRIQESADAKLADNLFQESLAALAGFYHRVHDGIAVDFGEPFRGSDRIAFQKHPQEVNQFLLRKTAAIDGLRFRVAERAGAGVAAKALRTVPIAPEMTSRRMAE